MAGRRFQDDLLGKSDHGVLIFCFLTHAQSYVLYNPEMRLFASPATRAPLLKATKLVKYNAAFGDSAVLKIHRVRVSTAHFITLAGLNMVDATPDAEIKLVSIPQFIFAVATRDTSLSSTYVSPHRLSHIFWEINR